MKERVMVVRKAGTILLNLENKQVGIVYRKSKNDYSFPKGHLEKDESLLECAVRETEEETLRANHLLINKEVSILKYSSEFRRICRSLYVYYNR